ncbi:MAG: hypothetical protein COV34_00505 [Candidatus Zambryskibacteria bacterium CG10_big_fil_rev_8_21_14_0_10_42_12]|uniref:Gluconeogenesis factor n=1 Tax=Candidatus Zambryskibacteria bacterium CG10_big_fil_rev_8_21_14_0_10_42_12 TaxID=1975115 RepID=A0A2H0QXR7_9BACT|nr:MAG: hypothetical protein COV34_00505 [Candidatus Zambryskibacteria bacterium CG10_big_fil_rev_8_21_14_0_10_42_12]
MEKGNINEKIALVGGGSGVYQIARALKFIRPNIVTVQTVFDSGGHSGALRDERGMLPPGDIRRAILALADEHVERNLRKILSYRFPAKNGSSLDDVNMGNLLLTALTEITGTLPQAINEMCMWYGVKGKVLPVSLDDAHIKVQLSDGSFILGEKYIDTRSINDDRTIVGVSLEPDAHLYVEVYDELLTADKIVLCPGDLYTSLLPNLIVKGFADALKESRGELMYVTNIMTKKSETGGFTANDFVKTVEKYLDGKKIDTVIVNDSEISKDILDSYKEQKSEPVSINGDLAKLVKRVIRADLVDIGGGIVRHNDRTASLIAEL